MLQTFNLVIGTRSFYQPVPVGDTADKYPDGIPFGGIAVEIAIQDNPAPMQGTTDADGLVWFTWTETEEIGARGVFINLIDPTGFYGPAARFRPLAEIPSATLWVLMTPAAGTR